MHHYEYHYTVRATSMEDEEAENGFDYMISIGKKWIMKL